MQFNPIGNNTNLGSYILHDIAAQTRLSYNHVIEGLWSRLICIDILLLLGFLPRLIYSPVTSGAIHLFQCCGAGAGANQRLAKLRLVWPVSSIPLSHRELFIYSSVVGPEPEPTRE